MRVARPHTRVLILLENASVPYDRRVTQEARSLVANGYLVTVICPATAGQPLRETLEGIDVRRYRPHKARGGAVSQAAEYLTALTKTLWLMLRLMFRPGFDVIQACNPPDLFFLIAVVFKVAGKRFIFDQHDLSPELYAALYGRDGGAVMRVLRWSERRSYRSADAVIVSNQSYRSLAVSRGGVDADRVFVVRNGPLAGWPGPSPPSQALKNGRRYLVVYMGVMGYQDGVDVLLHAVDILIHSMGFEDATFAIIGSGNAEKSLRELAQRLHLDDFVDFRGWISDEGTLSQYLSTADVCVCPEPSSPLNDKSTFIKVMEYMASRTPIVAFDLSETRFSAGDVAVYAPPGDTRAFAEGIREVLTDHTRRSDMISAAEARMPSLRWERQVPNLLAAYEHALSAGSRESVTVTVPESEEAGGATERL